MSVPAFATLSSDSQDCVCNALATVATRLLDNKRTLYFSSSPLMSTPPTVKSVNGVSGPRASPGVSKK